MPGIACAQKPNTPPPDGADPVFSSLFYKPYEAAAQSALQLLDNSRAILQAQTGENPVRSMTFRLKSPASIRDKLSKKGIPASSAAACSALRDIAGLRVILTTEEAVYRFADLIRKSPTCEYLCSHDYIAAPKPSGYRSLHLLLRIPVCLQAQAYMVPVEIQLRTYPMDVWASIEHAACYKPTLRA